MIQSIKQNIIPKAGILIDTTPEKLREIADRLEALAKNYTLPGQMIYSDFTESVNLVYNPELSVDKYESRLLSRVDTAEIHQ